MQTITYRHQPHPQRTLIHAAFALMALGTVAWSIYLYWESGAAEWDLFGLKLVFFCWMMFLWGLHIGRTSVTLDDEGLTYTIGWTSRRWAWAELSAPEIYSRDGRVDPYIRFRPEKLDWMARLTWLSWRSRPEIRIPHHYDSSLTEICAKLNECRDRAIGGERAAARE